jgi:hypothetical protein
MIRPRTATVTRNFPETAINQHEGLRLHVAEPPSTRIAIRSVDPNGTTDLRPVLATARGSPLAKATGDRPVSNAGSGSGWSRAIPGELRNVRIHVVPRLCAGDPNVGLR